MSSRPARRVAGLLLLAAIPAAAVLLRPRAGDDRPPAVPEPATQAFAPATAAVPKADSARPAPRPPRPVTPGVELVVNIPSGRLELFEGERRVRSYPVSVGAARYATPRGRYLVSRVIYNPSWNPPPDSEWARDRKPEPPGPRNPMGRVKLHMSDLYYVHGTVAEGRLGAPASHGCIRMANRDVLDLARRLQRLSDPGVADARLDALAADDRRTRDVALPRAVRLRVSYEVAVVRDGRLHVFPDVYDRVGGAFADTVRGVLARGGHADVRVGAEAMGQLRRRAAARGGASFAVADLPALRAPDPAPPAPVRLLGREIAPPPAAAPADSAAVAQAEPAAEPVAQP